MSFNTRPTARIVAILGVLSSSALFLGCPGPTDPPKPTLTCETDFPSDYQQGRSDGSAAGTAAGAALTFDQGKAETYNAAYQSAYSQSYNTGKSDKASYDKGYNDGYAVGANDTAFQADGATQGALDGFNEGMARGAHDGYNDSYSKGYNAGRSAGVYAGCSTRGLSEAASATDAQSCHNKGYNETYQAAYDAAKASNQQYKDGRAAGVTQGTNDGNTAGFAAGKKAAYDTGYLAGVKKGQDAAWITAYNYAFVNGAYDSSGNVVGGVIAGYNYAYFDWQYAFLSQGTLVTGDYYSYLDTSLRTYIGGYPAYVGETTDPNTASLANAVIYGYGWVPQAPSSTTGYGGAGDGFRDGFDDAQAINCHWQPSGSWYGFGSKDAANAGNLQFWAFIQNNTVIDGFAKGYSSYMSQDEAAAMDASVAQWHTYNSQVAESDGRLDSLRTMAVAQQALASTLRKPGSKSALDRLPVVPKPKLTVRDEFGVPLEPVQEKAAPKLPGQAKAAQGKSAASVLRKPSSK